jgi:hypothetical protein
VPRYFTLTEAESLLPEVENLLLNCIQAKQDYDRAEEEIKAFMQRIALTGGMVVSTEKVAHARNRKDASARIMKGAFEKLEQIGCLVKDLDLGLIDFPTLYKDKEVYLCWKLGESGISYWHHVKDGFAGRRAIDSEFLSHHRGS